MCTSILWNNGGAYFGRNMDISFDFDREIVITPRNYPIRFKDEKTIESHYAFFGTAMVASSYPLYAEAMNEKGVYIAGLNFPNRAVYYDSLQDKNNITVNELIPWVLAKCASLSEVRELMKCTNVTKYPFNEHLPIPTLHFMVADSSGSIVIECMENGMQLHDNEAGVMTNNPSFEMQMHNLNNYMHLSPIAPKNKLTKEMSLEHYCAGMGAIGLPGDFSSQSRFVRAFYLKTNSTACKDSISSVNQMFHMLDNLAMVKGAVIDENGKDDITVYSCCFDASKKAYYYKTYNGNCIQAVHMERENLNGDALISIKHSDNFYICDLN